MVENTPKDECAEKKCTFRQLCFARAQSKMRNNVVPSQTIFDDAERLRAALSQSQDAEECLGQTETIVNLGGFVAAYLSSNRGEEEFHAVWNVLELFELSERDHADLDLILDTLKFKYLQTVGLGQIGEVKLGTGLNHDELDMLVRDHDLQFECVFPCLKAGFQRCFRARSMREMEQHIADHHGREIREVGIYAVNFDTMRYAFSLSNGEYYVSQLASPNNLLDE